MNNFSTKISIFIIIAALISACNVVKKVPTNKSLLTKNKLEVNGKNINDEKLTSLIVQQPNSSILGFKLRLHLYNLAKENTDSLFKAKYINNPKKYIRQSKWLSKKQVDRLGKSFWYSGVHTFLKKTGEPPVILDTAKIKRSIKQLKAYHFNEGYFNAKTQYKVNYKNRFSEVDYKVITGEPTFLDTISTNIETPAIDSLYQLTQNKSLIKAGEQYKTLNFDNERARLTSYFKNHGVYHFQRENIDFVIDTTTKKSPVRINIYDREIKEGDSIKKKPHQIYRISEVNIYTIEKDAKNQKTFADSAITRRYNIYSNNKLRYRPRAITSAVFIQKDSLYSEDAKSLTLRSLSNLNIFYYPNIEYKEDSIGKLKVNIFLKSKDKFSFKANADFTHSNIQQFGISGSTSVSMRNIFRGAEILEIGLRGNIGSSKQFSNPEDSFFNVTEIGADLRLSFPRLFLPFKTTRIIPKRMFPTSYISAGFARQQNIGLDKENFTSIINYSWTPKKNNSFKFDLINVQYVKNVNVENYFNVYNSSYTRLNELAHIYNTIPLFYDEFGNLTKEAGGADGFMYSALNNQFPALDPLGSDYRTIQGIKERKDRLTENNLIFASNLSYYRDSKTDFLDREFYSFRGKVESAGNFLSLLSGVTKQKQNPDGTKEIFGLQYSQYIKSEFEFIKHWDLNHNKIIAFRSFFGIAIPYGNSTSIPFSRSYFAGGTNDNRAWESYSLGPGSSGGLNDFNEANMKIALNAEYRFNFFGSLNGALFADCGNIWNVSDSETDETKIFSGFKSLESLALGSGIGFRYDFNFFLVRLDLGFKTYNPARIENQRWLKEMRFDKSVLNIGINYPF